MLYADHVHSPALNFEVSTSFMDDYRAQSKLLLDYRKLLKTRQTFEAPGRMASWNPYRADGFRDVPVLDGPSHVVVARSKLKVRPGLCGRFLLTAVLCLTLRGHKVLRGHMMQFVPSTR